MSRINIKRAIALLVSCQYCGSNNRLTLDHVIPVSTEGQHQWGKVVTACEQCN